mmetsp:Transcript_103389/g.182187  ORF Transcript_103389/g.182187 Transcript_103389/m.182187 type:complete len:208 (-) Transcript_103389:7-630(-)
MLRGAFVWLLLAHRHERGHIIWLGRVGTNRSGKCWKNLDVTPMSEMKTQRMETVSMSFPIGSRWAEIQSGFAPQLTAAPRSRMRMMPACRTGRRSGKRSKMYSIIWISLSGWGTIPTGELRCMPRQHAQRNHRVLPTYSFDEATLVFKCRTTNHSVIWTYSFDEVSLIVQIVAQHPCTTCFFAYVQSQVFTYDHDSDCKSRAIDFRF